MPCTPFGVDMASLVEPGIGSDVGSGIPPRLLEGALLSTAVPPILPLARQHGKEDLQRFRDRLRPVLAKVRRDGVEHKNHSGMQLAAAIGRRARRQA